MQTDEHVERERGQAITQAGVLGKLVDAGGNVFAAALIIATVILVAEVVLRYVFASPTSWVHETTIFLVALTFSYGGLYCAARDSHIRVVILYDVVKGKWRRYLDIIISLVCASASGIFAWAAWSMVKKAVFRPDGSVRLETTGSQWDPAFPAYLKIFLFCVLFVTAIQFVVLAVNFARGKEATK